MKKNDNKAICSAEDYKQLKDCNTEDYQRVAEDGRVGNFFDFLKKNFKKSDLFKSDFFLFKLIFSIFFLSNHPAPLEVNQSNSAQRLGVDNSNNAIKVKQI